MYYKLDEDKNPVKVDILNIIGDVIERVDYKRFSDDTYVSTMFLAVGVGDRPKLFETMVFSENLDISGYMERYYTWDEAKEGHDRIVKAVERGDNLNNRKEIKLKLNLKLDK